MPDSAPPTGQQPAGRLRGDQGRLALLCDELQRDLGAFGFLWLCACAVYPGLRFPLSVYLGRRLAEAVGRPPPDEDEHLALFRLPWFRTGWIPQDLRLALLQHLDPAMRQVVREAIETLLFSALNDAKRDPNAAPPLDFAPPPRRWRAILRGWLEAVPPGAPARDTIFVQYMMGRALKPADLRLNRRLARLFGARLAGWFDRHTLTLGALALATTAAMWLFADDVIKPLFTEEQVQSSGSVGGVFSSIGASPESAGAGVQQRDSAQEYGTPAEAKAMLEKVAAALKVDQAKALQMFTKGEGGFREKDLYPYCGGPDGNFTAHPVLLGKSFKDVMDKGTPPKPYGQEVYAAAQPGKISEVSYMWPRPGATEPVEKVAYVTKVGDQTCAIGFYKQ